jgi:ABC-type antimicrobial peptide transport system permease subunit
MRKEENSSPVTALVIETDSKYAATYGIPLLAGSFLKDNKDTFAIVINETALKAMGWSNAEEAIGKSIGNSYESSYTILGVVKDFHFTSMKEQIKPIVFINFNLSPHYRFMSFKMKAGNISQNLETLHQKWAQLLNGAPFEYKFMDETLAELYITEIRLEKAAYISAALSVLIVLLGIIGLISISIQKRIKEIGIRKVLGSSPQAIVSLFLKEFLLIVFISGLIICPFAWYVFQNWLNDYSYRISLTSQPFIMSILILSGITLLLIGTQTLKAALTNPVKSLRTE